MAPTNYKINCFIEPHYPLKKSLLVSAAKCALENAKVKGKAEISISIIGDRKMKNLNKEYRGIDQSTDVLSFPYSLDSDKKGTFINPPSKYLNLGDVIISYPQLLERAAKEETMVDDMAKILVAHGSLHLLGYDHDKPAEAEVMENLEDQILSSL